MIIDKRRMISDIVQVYNSSVYKVEIAISVFKNSTYKITNELLKSKIDTSLVFSDVFNLYVTIIFLTLKRTVFVGHSMNSVMKLSLSVLE